MAIGIFALGGFAVGIYSIGGGAIALNVAAGGFANGHIAIGDSTMGDITFKINQSLSGTEIERVILQEFSYTPSLFINIIKMFI